MKMVGNTKKAICLATVLLLIVSFLIAPSFLKSKQKTWYPKVFVGIDAAFASVNDTKQLIDQVKSYTSLFVVGSTAITWNESYLNDVCQYLNDSGLHFMTFAHPGGDQYFPQASWVIEAREKWSPNFMGLYVYDEPGGHQIEHDTFFMCAPEASNYSDAAAKYVENLTYYLGLVKSGWNIGGFPVVTSDFALNEFDYRAGYSAVFTEFDWTNNSRPLSVALDRGAATVHNSDWGVMITGNVSDATQETGQQMYNDMVYAYKNGAKYILVFDYPSLQNGLLKQEHFDAIKLFWQYIQNHPQPQTSAANRVAYVVPKDYGFGFRSQTDTIWGLWNADNQSAPIWNQIQTLIRQYGDNLDVVYEDSPLNSSVYSKLIFWNGTTITR